MSSILKYIFVISCFLLCLIRNFAFLYDTQVSLLLFALFFTVCADYFLIFTDKILTGILLFVLVQLCYWFFLGGTWISLQKGLLLLTLFLLPLAYFSEILIFPAVLYLGCLCANIRLAQKHKKYSALSGLTLLFLCDVHLGLANLPLYISLPSSACYSFAARILWFFYLPSQLLLSLSARK